MGQFGVGQASRRVEDVRFLTGRGRYTEDIRLAGEAVGAVLRSPHAHGEIGAKMTCPNGCHACELEIDRATGAVQGIGQALLEKSVYDPQSGQLLIGFFMDYCMPRADDFPQIELILVEDFPCTTNELGVKGAGEAGSIGAAPATINAVLDALKPLGVRHIDMPATPGRVWRAIRDARGRGAA